MLDIKNLPRIFKHQHKSLTLKDPDPSMSSEQVLSFYSGLYPELAVARIEGPSIKDGSAEYIFTTTVGSKG